MGCAASTGYAEIEAFDTRPPDFVAATQSEASARFCFGLKDLACRVTARPLESNICLRLAVTELAVADGREAWLRVEAACERQDFAVLAARLEVHEGREARLSFDVAACFGEPIKQYELGVPPANFRVTACAEGPSDKKLHLAYEGLHQVGLLGEVMDVSKKYGYFPVRAAFAVSSRAPNATLRGDCWLQRDGAAEGGGLLEGDCDAMIKDIELAMKHRQVELAGGKAKVIVPLGDGDSTEAPTPDSSVSSLSSPRG